MAVSLAGGNSGDLNGMNGQSGSLEGASDETLLMLFSRGDSQAAQLLVGRLAPGVLRLATSLLGDRAEAEDVTQEAMIRLWKIAPDWRQGEARVSTWLWRVTSNLCTDRLRRRRNVALDDIAEPGDERPGAVSSILDRQRAKSLSVALQKLPNRQRTAVALRHLEGLSNPEIAEAMETSVEAVESLTARGMRGLRTQLLKRRKELGWIK